MLLPFKLNLSEVNLIFKNHKTLAPLVLQNENNSFTIQTEDKALYFQLNGKDKINLDTESIDILNGSNILFVFI